MMAGFVGKTEKRFILISIISLLSLLAFINMKMPVATGGEWKEVGIPAGSSYSLGLNILKSEGIIENDFIFLLFGKVSGIETKLRSGYYNLSKSMSPWDIFSKLKNGEIVEHKVRLVEGSDLDDLKQELINAGLIDDTSWELVSNTKLLSSLNVDAPTLEGYIYPDTYRFAKGEKAENIFRIMVSRMRQKFDQPLRKRAEELSMSENEVLTLASIIEKEAFLDSERPLISAVYHNRLKRKMKLQADPTVTYGTDRSGYRISKKDLSRKTEYNTYSIKGLPPGPIASPSIKSIRAALFPADVKHLFFVSKNNGSHHFSATGKEHYEAVALYRIERNRKEKK
jgi:UPF0755 protein